MLRALLRCVCFDAARDRLICVGDFIDRGPDARLLLDLYAEGALHSVIGNHEAMYILGEIGPYSREGSLPRADHNHFVRIARAMPLTLEVELLDGRTVGVVHAEVANGDWNALRQSSPVMDDATGSDLSRPACRALWGRCRSDYLLNGLVPPEAPMVAGIDLVISGHSGIPQKVLHYGNQVMLETIAYFAFGAMTLFEPLSGRFWQVNHPIQGQMPAAIELSRAQALGGSPT